ncbi:ATP phosphoribosyltransferase regulatory subunit [Magnetospirillum aberrantis]|uniref:ATP phosphoribosyltransferase regulatory subunit n=1 Tax=Magnetospirillum aberrantis SpK TaxID=908842 RepID=A0A7C9QST1_9PROT|nr:ATP phosphoribosyltransferase regulatory subunit [Magnetospirillum aberrantis]NFV79700.1 ATP phosphoribosyltransferase regulatory subunit [Magnetospirillum aberrantis SpK]
MNELANRALLPAGLRDILPLDAEHEANVVSRLMAHFSAQGYERVKPPLIEFEETLLAGVGSASASQCFRVMDPHSQKMMGVRADMTPQVARIAVTRLAGAARPLRLSYAGQVLLVKGSQLRPERQFGQAGLELIGPDSAAADAEVAVLAAEALAELGVAGVSIDLSLPSLVPTLLAELKLSAEESLRGSLDHKDAAGVAAQGGAAAPVLSALLSAVGPAERALPILAALELPPAAAAVRDRLAQVVALIREAAPELTLTVDPVENRGFEYHTGIAFTLFGRNLSSELGRGGRYLAGGVEPATGATLFMDTVLAVLPAANPPRRILIPTGTPRAWAQALRAQGWITVAALETADDWSAEAKRMGCGHVLAADGVKNV